MSLIDDAISQIATAVYGKDVRSAIVTAFQETKANNDSVNTIRNDVNDIKAEILEARGNVNSLAQAFGKYLSNAPGAVKLNNLSEELRDDHNNMVTLSMYNAGMSGKLSNANGAVHRDNLDAGLLQTINNRVRSETYLAKMEEIDAELEDKVNNGVFTSVLAGKANTTQIANLQTQIDSQQTQINSKADERDLDILGSDVNLLYGVMSDVRSYIGYTENDILGLQVDFANNRFARLAAAEGLTAGEDFDDFAMYGDRKRVVVDSNGEIVYDDPEDVADLGDTNDSDYDIMVYQPKFYYKVVPLKLEKQENGLGYHIRKANYYISANPHPGFKIHPVFIDANGNEVDYVLFSAYEASYLWNRQVSTSGFTPTYFDDDTDTSTAFESTAVLKSMPNVKPISGKYKAMTKSYAESLAQRKGSNWHIDTIQSISANQLLMMIEYGKLDMQTAMGSLGISTVPSVNDKNCSCLTGSTVSLGNASGTASSTYPDQNSIDTDSPYTTNGRLAVSYRGMENPWGNSWKHVNGINLFGDGTMNGGQAYVCSDFGFNESKHDGNYKPTGLFLTNAYGYSSAFAYGGEEYDWMFIPSESGGNSSNPIGDIADVVSNLDGYRIVMFGGPWYSSTSAGEFCTYFKGPVNHKYSNIGCRLLFVPTANV